MPIGPGGSHGSPSAAAIRTGPAGAAPPGGGAPAHQSTATGRAGGHRVELVDGIPLVGPTLAAPHQRAVRRLARAFEAVCRPPLEVFSPFTLRVAPDTEVVPDVAVVAVDEPLPRYPRDARVVAEVLSPRSRRADVVLKGRVYADAGVPVLLVVDPDAVTLAVHVLRGAAYVEVARAARDGLCPAARPGPGPAQSGGPDAAVGVRGRAGPGAARTGGRLGSGGRRLAFAG